MGLCVGVFTMLRWQVAEEKMCERCKDTRDDEKNIPKGGLHYERELKLRPRAESRNTLVS